MIDYKKKFIFNVLNESALRKLGNVRSRFFYDRRTKTAFRKILAAPRPYTKYYFADTTMKRVEAIDLKKCYPTKLNFLFEKYGGEIGIGMCKEDDLSFIYVIGATNIQLIVISGNKKTTRSFKDRYGNINDAGFEKAMVGACVIDYYKNDVDILSTSLMTLLFSKYNLSDFALEIDEINKLRRMQAELKLFTNDFDWEKLDYNKTPTLYNAYQDVKIKSDKIWKAIKMFVFLKTAKVIDQTFVSESKMYGKYSTAKLSDTNGIIIVNSNWDSSIHVVNPFAVSGHFRNQPKKNKNNEWYFLGNFFCKSYCLF